MHTFLFFIGISIGDFEVLFLGVTGIFFLMWWSKK